MIDDNTSRCTKCQEEKPVSEFRQYRGRGDKWYLRSECKDCEKRLSDQLRELKKTVPAPPSNCECCGTPLYEPRLDHDHTTGEFRGWLCQNCNEGFGKFGDNVEGIEKAYAYITRSSIMSTSETEVLPTVEVTVKVTPAKTTEAPKDVTETTEQKKTLLLEEIDGLDKF
jgi:hypothetical protein